MSKTHVQRLIIILSYQWRTKGTDSIIYSDCTCSSVWSLPSTCAITCSMHNQQNGLPFRFSNQEIVAVRQASLIKWTKCEGAFETAFSYTATAFLWAEVLQYQVKVNLCSPKFYIIMYFTSKRLCMLSFCLGWCCLGSIIVTKCVGSLKCCDTLGIYSWGNYFLLPCCSCMHLRFMKCKVMA